MGNLENIKKRNNFSVPKDYFEYLPSEIMERANKVQKQREIFFLKPAFAIFSVVVFAGVIILIVFLLKSGIPSEEVILSANDIQHIIDNPDLYNIDEEAVTNAILSSNIPADSLNADVFASEDEIKYFLEENSNTYNIINNL